MSFIVLWRRRTDLWLLGLFYFVISWILCSSHTHQDLRCLPLSGIYCMHSLSYLLYSLMCLRTICVHSTPRPYFQVGYILGRSLCYLLYSNTFEDDLCTSHTHTLLSSGIYWVHSLCYLLYSFNAFEDDLCKSYARPYFQVRYTLVWSSLSVCLMCTHYLFI